MSDPVIHTTSGALRGVEQDGLMVFKGIPYARPPVGALRWRPPLALDGDAGTRDCLEFGAACPQPGVGASSVYATAPMPMSEDCLSLNIWSPAGADRAPVFVWIHGGAFWNGASCDPMYDGRHLAQQGLTVVSINYRLGVFGWLSHPELSAESGEDRSGNYGLLDQIAALQWVRANIAEFGGDPGNVTIAGESAGATSVMYLMASPLARGLFARAIAQSAYMIATPSLRAERHGLAAAETTGERLCQAASATDIAQLRTIGAPDLMRAAAVARFSPFGTVDGTVLPDQLVAVFDRGEQAPVPILAGFNSGEIRSLHMLAPAVPGGTAEYVSRVQAAYGDLASAFLALYPPTHMAESILAATRDGLYGWTAERLVRDQTALGQGSFLYLFNHGYDAADAAGLTAFHASEIPFVLGTLDATPPNWPAIPATPEQVEFSRTMMAYWAGFAREGAPGASWPAYNNGEAYLEFGDAPRAGISLMPGMFTLHEEMVRRRRQTGKVAWNWNVGIAASEGQADI